MVMEVSAAPPSYRRFSSRSGQVPQPMSSADLPAYSRHNTRSQPSPPRRELTEHIFELSDGKSKPWATLTLYSSAKSSKSLPTFFEKENITGKLELTAERGDSIQAIAVTITGSIISGSTSSESSVFLNYTLPIWAKTPDTPRVPSPSDGASASKLLGHCEWPLSITLPRTVEVPTGGGDVRSFKLPETFLERYTPVSIQYDLKVTISRGKLRSDNMIKTAFGYVPNSRPEPNSMLRQCVYDQDLPIPDPSVDPEGWKTMRPVSVRGQLFKSIPVEARCTLSVSKPLCFTRGSVLPCFMTLEGRDPKILDVLSSPNSAVVKLRRRLRFSGRTTSSKKEMIWNETVEDVGTAVWWTPMNSPQEPHSRRLEGEIRLAKDLRPTTEIAHLSIQYFIVLCPFQANNYSSDAAALLSEPVEIATMYAKGPRPKAYAPPSYDAVPRNEPPTQHFYAPQL